MKRIRGLIPALITPFDSGGNPDTEAFARLVDFQMKNGVDGLFVCGSTGLGPLLNREERNAIVEFVLSRVRGRIPVVVQVGAADTLTSVQLAEHARSVGAEAIACLTPFYYKADATAVKAHFERVSAAAHSPILAYNIPRFTGNNLGPELVLDLEKDGLIFGIKESSGDFGQLVKIQESLPEDFVILNGTESYGLSALQLGISGLVSATSSAFPELFCSLTRSFIGGSLGEARAIQARINRLKKLTEGAPIASLYEVLREKGIPCGLPRPPIRRMTKSEREALVSSLRNEGFLSA